MYRQGFIPKLGLRWASTSMRNITAPSKRRLYDNRYVLPMVLLVLVGSIAANRVDTKRRISDMQQPYYAKLRILEQLLERARAGDTSFDMASELDIVNRVLERHRERSGRTEKRVETYTDEKHAVQEESLDDLLNSIMRDLDNPVEDGAAANPAVDLGPIVTDRDALAREALREKESVDFRADSEPRVIVQTPGEYVAAAEDTAVPRFL
ncbi:AaceriACL094Wp [[Ashbya] aceris (nom. inval.)]|nr:AaceriACL094Wp [[Ashbya] aceris (nom. inval.)]